MCWHVLWSCSLKQVITIVCTASIHSSPIPLCATLPVTANSYWWIWDDVDDHVLHIIHGESPTASSNMGSLNLERSLDFLAIPDSPTLQLTCTSTTKRHYDSYKNMIPCFFQTEILPNVFLLKPDQGSSFTFHYATLTLISLTVFAQRPWRSVWWLILLQL